MNQPTHRERAEQLLHSAEHRLHEAIELSNANGMVPLTDLTTASASVATAHAVLAHLDDLALPEPGTGDVILDAARKLDAELAPVQDHDHGGLTPGSDDQAQARETPAPSVAGVTNPGSPVSLDAGNGSGQIRAGLIDRLAGVLSARQNLGIVATSGARHYSLDDQSVYRLAGDAATALLEDGWRPPLPDGETEDSRLRALTAQRDDAQRAGLKFATQLSEIRAVLAPLGLYATGADHLADALRRIRAIVGGVLPPAPQVFFPGDIVPAGLWTRNQRGRIGKSGADMAANQVEVEVPDMSDAEWQSAVDRASAEREQSTPDSEHADDCTGCDGPGIVPCAADRVIGNTAFRNGQPIKDLEAGRG